MAATVLAALLDRWVSLTSQAMLYLLAVTLAAYRLPWTFSAACAVAAVTALNFFFVPPRYTLEVENHEYLIALAAMLAVALLVSHLASAARRDAERRAAQRGARQALQALAIDLAAADDDADLLALGRAALRECFEGYANVVALEPAAAGASAPSAQRSSTRCAAACASAPCSGRARRAGPASTPGTCRCSPASAPRRRLPAAGRGPPTVELREHAQALCAVIGQALARSRLGAEPAPRAGRGAAPAVARHLARRGVARPAHAARR